MFDIAGWRSYYTANGILTTGEFLIGTSLNLICLSYFLRKHCSAINLLFVFVSGTDLALSSIMLFSAISAFAEGRPLMFENKLFCNIWGLIWHTACGFSIYLMAVLAVTRWLGLVHPLRRIKRRFVAVSILIYLAIQVFKSTMNYWYMEKAYSYNPVFLGCSVNNINTQNITVIDKLLYTFLYIFEVLLPGIPAIVFSIATFVSLLKKDKNLQRNNGAPMSKKVSPNRRWTATSEMEDPLNSHSGWERKRDATITILILIATYLVLNLWFWLLTLGDAFYIFSDKTLNYTTIWNGDVKSYYMTYYVIYIHTVVLNSTANAIIYILRLKGLKTYIIYMCKSGKKTEVYSNRAVLKRKSTATSVFCRVSINNGINSGSSDAVP